MVNRNIATGSIDMINAPDNHFMEYNNVPIQIFNPEHEKPDIKTVFWWQYYYLTIT